MTIHNNEVIKAEFFGNVRRHQSAAVNYQLANCLKVFDDEYKKCGGRLNSLGHHFDRMEFAQFVSRLMIDDLKNMDDIISEMKTEVSFSCSSIPFEISVTSKTKFGDDINNSPTFPYFNPN